MAFLFKPPQHSHAEDPHRKLTRFKKVHVRDAPVQVVDRGIDPHEALSRSEHRHVRTQVVRDRTLATPRPFQPMVNMAAHLHATDPISIDVLHRALPMRAATIAG